MALVCRRGDLGTIAAHAGTVRRLDFSWDGGHLVSCSDDKSVKIWHVPSRRFQASFLGHTHWVRTAHFNARSTKIASGGDDKTVRLWDVESRKQEAVMYDHTATVNDTVFHPDGSVVAACSDDCSVKLWDARSGRLLQHYDAHVGPVRRLAFHPSGNYLASTSDDATVKLWDLREGRLMYTLYGHEGPSLGVSFTGNGGAFASGGSDGVIMLWRSHLEEDGGPPSSGSSVKEEPSAVKRPGTAPARSVRPLPQGKVSRSSPHRPSGPHTAAASSAAVVTERRSIARQSELPPTEGVVAVPAPAETAAPDALARLEKLLVTVAGQVHAMNERLARLEARVGALDQGGREDPAAEAAASAIASLKEMA
jgi:WD40 repeat protein